MLSSFHWYVHVVSGEPSLLERSRDAVPAMPWYIRYPPGRDSGMFIDDGLKPLFLPVVYCRDYDGCASQYKHRLLSAHGVCSSMEDRRGEPSDCGRQGCAH